MTNRPTRRERVLVQRADDQTVLLDVDSGSYFALNDVGACIWGLLDGTHDVEAIVTAVCREYDAPADDVRVDVLALLEELRSERLLAGA